MALASCPARQGQQRSFQRMRQDLSWALGRVAAAVRIALQQWLRPADTGKADDHCFHRGPFRAAAHGAGEDDRGADVVSLAHFVIGSGRGRPRHKLVRRGPAFPLYRPVSR
jgi:hypothetical protein